MLILVTLSAAESTPDDLASDLFSLQIIVPHRVTKPRSLRRMTLLQRLRRRTRKTPRPKKKLKSKPQPNRNSSRLGSRRVASPIGNKVR